MELLRFLTAGSVDDGKSTLIGRLLFDTDSIYQDHLEAVSKSGTPDLAILTDGLKAEREQGITIDVAYKYFNTSKRKFIIADAPGHVQYTRNMVTAASQSDLAVLLVDARQGVVEQTRRHSYLVSLLGIRKLVVCINKMDLVGYAEERFEAIEQDFRAWAKQLDIPYLEVIPVSALQGQGVVNPPAAMPWYQGPTLLQLLENAPLEDLLPTEAGRMPVQYVVRPQREGFHDFRGYAGRVLSGSFTKGQAVTIWPGGQQSTVASLHSGPKELARASTLQSVTLQLSDDIDISRGDMIAAVEPAPQRAKQLTATLCWMDDTPQQLPGRYRLQLHGRHVRCRVQALESVLDIHTLKPTQAESLALNDIGTVRLQLAEELAYEPYAQNRMTGAALLIDERTHSTAGAVLLH